MIRLAVFALGALLCAPALAQEEARIVLEIRNEASQAITRFNVYPVDEDGDAVEDNLGALMEDVPAGQATELELGLSKCALIRAYVGMADDSEIEGDIDTCKERTVVVGD